MRPLLTDVDSVVDLLGRGDLDAVFATAHDALEGGAARRTIVDSLLAPAPGEQHTVGSRMAAIAMRDEGVAARVEIVDRWTLAALLEAEPPDLLGVSCNMPCHLAGAIRLAHLAHRDGVRVVAGGRAFDGRPERARLAESSVADRDAFLAAQSLQARADSERVSMLATLGMLDETTTFAVDHAIRSMESAVMCRDRSLITDELRWLERILGTRGAWDVYEAITEAADAALAPWAAHFRT